jgi:hypothetical protein
MAAITGWVVGALRVRVVLVWVGLLVGCVWLCGVAGAVGDANVSSCPSVSEGSPGFRGFLPDCRAYELVSPSYGAGALAAGVKNHAPWMSPDGEGLLAISFGGFGQTEELKQEGSEELGAVYEFSRTAAGWTAEPQDPSAALYPFHAQEAWGAGELNRSVWKVPGPVSPGEEPELYWFRLNEGEYVLREGRGQFVPVGPITAPGHETNGRQSSSFVQGVSGDVAHVVFSVAGEDRQLWSGDGTVSGRSLYEYVGTGNSEPVLVGVRNSGAAPWRAGVHRNEGAELVSECGTEYAGMSVSGERVFFTALAAKTEVAGHLFCEEHEGVGVGVGPAANEVYARVGGVRTVAISSPSKEDCAACDTEGPPEPATFTGASEDGSRVFFASEAQLFAGANGEAGQNLYEYNFAGPAGGRVRFVAPDVTPVVTKGVAREERVADVTADGGRVYFESTVALTGVAANGNGETAEKALEHGASVLLYVYDSESGGLSFVAGARKVPEPAGFFTLFEPEPFKALGPTRDGGFLVFETATDLEGTGDTSSVPQVFEYEAATGRVVRVSIGQRSPDGFECASTGTIEEGYDCEGNTSIEEDAPRVTEPSLSAIAPDTRDELTVNSVAADGRVVFSSELALAPGAVPGERFYNPESGSLQATRENVYEYRAGQVYLISPGDEAKPAHFQNAEAQTRLFGIDESGRDVFFESADRLVPQDTDTQGSWYDAREGGGFPAPTANSECSGEACQGSGPVAPVLAPPESESVSGGENVPPAATGGVVKPRSVAVVRAEGLRRALRVCRRLRAGKRRRVCEEKARAKFAPKPTPRSKSSVKRGGK